MRKLILLFVFFPLLLSFSQQKFVGNLDNFSGNFYKITTIPELNYGGSKLIFHSDPHSNLYLNGSMVRWNSSDPASIGNDVAFSGNGLYGVIGWGLNNERVALHNNLNSIPVWQFVTSTNAFRNYVAVSDTAGVIAVSSYQNFYLLDKDSSLPFFNFDLTTTLDTGTGGPIDITSDGNYFIAGASRNDSSWIYCFNRNSTVSLWRTRIKGQVYGVRISGNDSLVIINGYYNYKVINVYTGDIRAEGTIDNGCQFPLGISGNGNVIVTGNYRGIIKVFQWNGSSYIQQWQYQEPPGTYYNWITSIDVSDDGNYIAVGTLIFLTSSSYDGRIRFFNRSSGNTPAWSFTGTGDQISFVSLSKNGKILAVTSWGPLDNSKEDILIFRADPGDGIPIFAINVQGSPFMCSVSEDGTSVITGGKAVHARQMGSGGTLYNIFVDTTTPVGIKKIICTNPVEFKLLQNYPNPFNSSTIIRFSILNSGNTEIKLYDISGKFVKTLLNRNLKPGDYEINFNSGNLPSGVYFYRLISASFSDSKKMIILK